MNDARHLRGRWAFAGKGNRNRNDNLIWPLCHVDGAARLSGRA